jgi:hypothetical protein
LLRRGGQRGDDRLHALAEKHRFDGAGDQSTAEGDERPDSPAPTVAFLWPIIQRDELSVRGDGHSDAEVARILADEALGCGAGHGGQIVDVLLTMPAEAGFGVAGGGGHCVPIGRAWGFDFELFEGEASVEHSELVVGDVGFDVLTPRKFRARLPSKPIGVVSGASLRFKR